MKTIWIGKKEENIYAEFKRKFNWCGGNACLKITASRGYAAYVNGRFVSNAQYADMPQYKAVDEIDITPFLSDGENTLTALVYHWDSDFATGKVMAPALAFMIEENGRIIAESDRSTLARIARGYYALKEVVTPQIGYGYGYDFCRESDRWDNAVEIECGFNYVPRPNKRLVLRPEAEVRVCAQGIYKYGGGRTSAERAMGAWLLSQRFAKMTGESRLISDKLSTPLTFNGDGGDGLFVIVDLGCESSGYLSLSVNVPRKCKAILTWGEHLADLRVRSEIGGRSFATEFMLKDGENAFDDYIHRIGARYLMLYIESPEFVLNKLTVREAVYPFKRVERSFSDRLIEKIYDTACRTLELSAHEHYEDCPWREQALYGMDSRNQMLFGYSAFGEYELPRSVLRLFARSARPSGLIELCAPANAPCVIPSFTLFTLLAIAENAEADYNAEFIKEMLPYAEHAIKAFTDRAGDYGISAFTESEYWNFHEWSDGLDGGVIFRDYEIEPYFDGPLTALTCIVLSKLAWLEEMVGNIAKAKEYDSISLDLKNKLALYKNSEKGLYYSFYKNGKFYGNHVYTHALYLIANAIQAADVDGVIAEIKHPKSCVPLTLAALQLKYESILKYARGSDYCIDEACNIFGKMIYSGATSFFETENGEADFDDAGSLCHGWSAVPCWLFVKLGLDR